MTYQNLLEALQKLTPEQLRQCVMVKHYAQVEPHCVESFEQCDYRQTLPVTPGLFLLFVP